MKNQVMHYVNLTNGIEWIPYLEKCQFPYSFIRIK